MTEHGPEADLRRSLLAQISEFLDKPMIALSIGWLVLMILELTRGLNPALMVLNNLIWAVFILDFLMALWIAPRRVDYIKRNWLNAISILLPAIRILRVFQVFK